VDRFDYLLVHRCTILSNDGAADDDYGQEVGRFDPSKWTPIAVDVHCWIDTNAIGRPHEEVTEPEVGEVYRIIYMRVPVLDMPGRTDLTRHDFIFCNGVYYDVFEAKQQFDGPRVHHLEVIVKEVNTSEPGEGGS
jgi:hypothetical protein